MARSTWLSLILGFGLFLLVGAAPDSALAQCCTPPPPVCCTPPTPPPCCTTPPPPQPPPCCTPPTNCCNHNVNIPGVNVFVAPSVVVNASASANVVAGAAASASSRAGAGTTVFYGGGGGGGYYTPPMSTGMIQGLTVDNRRAKRVAYQASRTRTRRVVIQAVCIDDRQIPHPASQVSPDRDIDEAFEGELYRCIAGTWLQATVADFDGRVDFSGGKTLACRKGDALYRGRDGQVTCRPQRPARDCNERSLLRRFGAGIKVLTMVITETYTAYREEEDRSEATYSGAMSLDGGVGGTVY